MIISCYRKALEEFKEQGGVEGRRGRYLSNRAILRKGMAEMGFRVAIQETFCWPDSWPKYWPQLWPECQIEKGICINCSSTALL